MPALAYAGCVSTPHPSPLRRRWSAAGRIALLAVAAALIFIIGYGMLLDSVVEGSAEYDALSARMLLDLALGALSLVLYGFRRRAPFVIPGIVVSLCAVSWTSAITAAALLVFVAASRRPVRIVIVSVAFVLAGSVDAVTNPLDDDEPLWTAMVLVAATTCVLVMIGLLIGIRRQAAEDRVARRTADEAVRIEQAKAQERVRIAREMHDVLGHRLSLMAVHAGALEYRDDLSHAQTVEAAGVIGENSRRALDELRDVLGVLRGDAAASAASAPQPAAADIPRLIDDARAAGATVDVEALEVSTIPAHVGRHAFRIVQELLTNARKHAPGSPVTLSATSTAGRIRIRVSNDASTTTDGPGFGLAGIAERVRLVGGEIEITRSDGVFQVEAVLPWTE